jgi:L-lactate dehydrogenase
MRGTVREIVLVDRTRERARAVATDLRYGTPLSPAVDIQDGDFDSLAGAALVMITAGVNEKTGGATDRKDAAGRLKLLDTNRGIAIMCAESPGDLVLRYLSLLKAPQG